MKCKKCRKPGAYCTRGHRAGFLFEPTALNFQAPDIADYNPLIADGREGGGGRNVISTLGKPEINGLKRMNNNNAASAAWNRHARGARICCDRREDGTGGSSRVYQLSISVMTTIFHAGGGGEG